MHSVRGVLLLALAAVLACGGDERVAADEVREPTQEVLAPGDERLPPEQQYARGMAFLYGRSLPLDSARAAKWLRGAAEAGHVEAQRELAKLYFAGSGVAKDAAEGKRWQRAAADGGDPEAAFELGLRALRGELQLPQGESGTQWLVRSAEGGLLVALLQLGRRALDEERGSPDRVQGHAWLNLAASRWQGVAGRRQAVEGRLSAAELVEAERRAREFYEAHFATEADPAVTPQAQYERGVAWARGLGRPRNRTRAVELLRPAAEAGHPAAQRDLALLLAAGRGVAADDAAALSWLRRAAGGGDVAAAYQLGLWYRDGDHASVSPLLAWVWLDAGARGGHPAAQRERAALELELDPATLGKAQKLAAELAPQILEPWRFEIVDASGATTPARVSLWGDDGAPVYPTRGRNHRGASGLPYFYTDGSFEISNEWRAVRVRVQKGFEFAPFEARLERGGTVARITLERVFDTPALGYASGDGHVHANYGPPKSHISNRALLEIMKAEDLNVLNLLAANVFSSEIHLADRVTGRPEPESEPDRILRVSEEYRSNVYGHMSVYGVQSLSDPLFTGLRNSPYPHDFPTNYEAASNYLRTGALASFAHLMPPWPHASGESGLTALECPVDVALGALRAIEVQGAVSTSLALTVWEHLMSSGFDMVVTAGSDAVASEDGGPIPGYVKSYVDLEGRPLSYPGFAEQLARGRGFTTNGPLVFLRVAGERPGGAIHLEPGETRETEVEVRVDSVFPWEQVVVRSNRERVLAFESSTDGARSQTFRGRLALEGPGWIYASVSSRPDQPETTQAVTNAIWVRSGDEPRRDPESLAYFVRWVDANLAMLEFRDNYGSPENREQVRDTFQRAREVFEERLEEARRRSASVPHAAANRQPAR